MYQNKTYIIGPNVLSTSTSDFITKIFSSYHTIVIQRSHSEPCDFCKTTIGCTINSNYNFRSLIFQLYNYFSTSDIHFNYICNKYDQSRYYVISIYSSPYNDDNIDDNIDSIYDPIALFKFLFTSNTIPNLYCPSCTKQLSGGTSHVFCMHCPFSCKSGID